MQGLNHTLTSPPGWTADYILSSHALSLPDLFRLRAEKSPESIAYMAYGDFGKWMSFSWQNIYQEMLRRRAAFAKLGLKPGDRIALLLNNGPEWIICEQAALSLGLLVVPLYTHDNAESTAYILQDSGTSTLLIQDTNQYQMLARCRNSCKDLKHIISVNDGKFLVKIPDISFHCLSKLLPDRIIDNKLFDVRDPNLPASIVYTSGTTGRPKGVILSHSNIMKNAEAVLRTVPIFQEDLFLSFLPLSHSFERTVGYYVPMMAGSTVAYARSAKHLAEDMRTIRPTILIGVPRVYENIFGRIMERLDKAKGVSAKLFDWTLKIGKRRFKAEQEEGKQLPLYLRPINSILQGQVADKVLQSFGGRLRMTVSGGAPLGVKISEFFLALGIPLVQGYGLTEAGPVVSANSIDNNNPESVGRPLPEVEVKLGANNELMIKSPGIMLGYWQNEKGTKDTFDNDGWMKTGDIADIRQGRIHLQGRLKDILVTSTGEKISPNDLETAILQDPLFLQALVVGEGKPFVAALIVLNPDSWARVARERSLEPNDPESLTASIIIQEVLARCRRQTKLFPAYAMVQAVSLSLTPWTIENGLITPTLKIKRPKIESLFSEDIKNLYNTTRPSLNHDYAV
ncbi:MAG: long-chain fatty acid--CoA ligase [Desulfobulbaceae bacterium]|nr:long-chain fatty acid--CoA ligase [Desulfobulbaceae bacterium]